MSDEDPGSLDERLRREADELLEDKGLQRLLTGYGIVHFSGSYALRPMAWRDLDIYLEVNDLPLRQFFALGGRIARLLRPVRMSFIDNRPGRLHDVPDGLYWGVRAGDAQDPWEGGWKIDIWAIGHTELTKNMAFQEDIKRRLNPVARDVILRIKSAFWRHPKYRKTFSGLAIYEAVLDHGVSTAEEFTSYLEERGLLQGP